MGNGLSNNYLLERRIEVECSMNLENPKENHPQGWPLMVADLMMKEFSKA